MRDFTLSVYKELLSTLLDAGYSFITYEEYCNANANGPTVILRHDVDLKAGHSLATAQIEHSLGIKATYYFRVVPQSNQPDMITAIARLNHEIGYHYEDLSLCNGDEKKAIAHFEKQLKHFRTFYPVKTICMHGSPTSKWDNRDIWKLYSYSDYDVIGEPYFDFLNAENQQKGIAYFTDTARMWDGDKFNVRDKSTHQQDQTDLPNIHSTFDFISWIKKTPTNNVIMITTHPQRWTDNWLEWITELILQGLKNRIKQMIINKKG